MAERKEIFMKLFLIILGINLALFTILFLYCACVVVGRSDRDIERMNQEKKN